MIYLYFYFRPETATLNESDNSNDLWHYHKQIVADKQTKSNTSINNYDIEPELRQYLDLPLVKLHDDVLEVWETYSSVFPNLYKLAQKYMSSVGSSVPSERLFSKAGNILTEKRNRLSENRISKLCFLQTIPKNYWNV